MPVETAEPDTPRTVADLGRLVKQKYPGYADLSDADLGSRVKAKYPGYADFADLPTAAATAPTAPAGSLLAVPSHRPESPRRAVATLRATPEGLPAMAGPGSPPEFIRGFRGGLVGQNVEAVGRTLRAVGIRGPGKALVRAGQSQAQAPKVASFRDAGKSPQKWFDYLQFQAGQAIASTVPSVAGAAIGGLVGAPAGPVGIAAGAVVGAAIPAYTLNFGDIAEEVDRALPEATPEKRAEIAALISVPVTALDVLPAMKFGGKAAKRLLVKKVLNEAAKRGVLERVLREGVKGAILEGIPEGVQETIQALSVAHAAGKKVDPDELVTRVVDATIGGALAGGAIGGAVEAIPQRRGAPGTTEAAAARANIATPPGLTPNATIAGREASTELSNTVIEIQRKATGPIRFEAPGLTIEDAHIVPNLIRVFPGDPNALRVTVLDNATGKIHSLAMPDIADLRAAWKVAPPAEPEIAPAAEPTPEPQPTQPPTPAPAPVPELRAAEKPPPKRKRTTYEYAADMKVERLAKASLEAKMASLSTAIPALERQIAERPGDARVRQWKRRLERLKALAPVEEVEAAPVAAPVTTPTAPAGGALSDKEVTRWAIRKIEILTPGRGDKTDEMIYAADLKRLDIADRKRINARAAEIDKLKTPEDRAMGRVPTRDAVERSIRAASEASGVSPKVAEIHARAALGPVKKAPKAKIAEVRGRMLVPHMQFRDERAAGRFANAFVRSEPGSDPKVVKTRNGYEIEINEEPVEQAPSVKKPTPKQSPVAPERQPTISPLEGPSAGRRTQIKTPSQNFEAQYQEVPIESLKPSHNPVTFEPNPEYPFEQQRDYRANKIEQMKVIGYAKAFNPDYILADTPTSTDGPPIVSREGYVLGGNARTMALLRGLETGDITELGLQRAIQIQGKKFGIENPGKEKGTIIVRRLLGDMDETAQAKATKALNEDFKMAVDPISDAIARAKNLSPDTVEWLSETLNDAGPEATIKGEIFDNPATLTQLLRRLSEDQVINASELPRILEPENGKLTPEGKSIIEAAIIGRVIKSPKMIREMSPNLKNLVFNSLSPLLQGATFPSEWRINKDVVNGLWLNHLADKANKSVEMMLEPQIVPDKFLEAMKDNKIAISLAKWFEDNKNKSTALRAALTKYNKFAAEAIGHQETLEFIGPAKSPDYAFHEAFGWKQRKPGGVPPSMMAVTRKGEEERVHVGFDTSIIRKLANKLYTSGLGRVIPRELLQNAVDALPIEGPGKITLDYNENSRTFVATDNGTGMSPAIVRKELVDLGGTQKRESAAGGFGLAKAVLYSNAESIKIETVALVENEKIETILSGTGESWTNPESGMTVSSRRVPDKTPTGTTTTISIAEKFPSGGDIVIDDWVLREFLQNFKDVSRVPLDVRLSMNGRAIETSEHVGTDFVKMKDFSTPGATVKLSGSKNEKKQTHLNVAILNNGMPQFNLSVSFDSEIMLPNRVLADVHPTVSPESELYPFNTSRDSIAQDAQAEIEEYLKKKLYDQKASEERKFLTSSVHDAPQMVSHPHLMVVDSSGGMSSELIQDIAKDQRMAQLAFSIEQQTNALGKAIHKKRGKSAYKRFAFLGFGLGDRYLGINIDAEYLAGKGAAPRELLRDIILMNPLNIFSEAANLLSQMNVREEGYYDALAEEVARQMAGTTVHEIVHQVERGHGEAFAGELTRVIGITATEVEQSAQVLKRILSEDGYELLGRLNKYYKRASIEWGRANIFARAGDTLARRRRAGRGEGPAPGSVGSRAGREEGLRRGGELAPSTLGAGSELRGSGQVPESAVGSFSGKSRTALESRQSGESWEKVAAKTDVSVARAKAMVDFAHLDPAVRSTFFPPGGETALFGDTAHGEIVGRYARVSPDLMTAARQRQWLSEAVNQGIEPALFGKEVQRWHSMLKAGKVAMTPKQFVNTSGRLLEAIDAKRRQAELATGELENVSEIPPSEGKDAVRELVERKLSDIGKEGLKLTKADRAIDGLESFDAIQKRIDEILGSAPRTTPLVGEGGAASVGDITESLQGALRRLSGIARRDPLARQAAKGPPPVPEAVTKILKALEGAKPVREQQEAMSTAERVRRIKLSRALERGKSGEAKLIARLSAFKGRLPKVTFTSIAKALNQSDVDDLVRIILKHPGLTFFDQMRTGRALQKLLAEAGGEVPQRNELELLEIVFGTKFVEKITGLRPQIAGTRAAALYKIANVTRTLRTSFDLSAPLRQGLYLGPSFPKEWGQAFVAMHRYWWSEGHFDAGMEEIYQDPLFQVARRTKLAITRPGGHYLSSQEEAFYGAQLATKIPLGIGGQVKRSERAYVGFLNKLRFDVFKELVGKSGALEDIQRLKRSIRRDRNNQALKNEIAALYERLRLIAKFVNAATGRGESKFIEDHADGLNAALFAPSLIQSRLHLTNPGQYSPVALKEGTFNVFNPKNWVRTDPFIRRQYIRSSLALAGTGVLALTLAGWAGARVERKRRNGDWGKIRVGENVYDILGGLVQYMRLYPTVAEAAWDQVRGRRLKYGNVAEILLRFGEHKLSPIAAFVVGLLRWKATQRDDRGKRGKFELGPEILRLFVPMIGEDFFEVMKSDPRQLPVAFPAALYGVSVQAYHAPRR